MNFKFLTGDCNWQKYGGKFISPRQNNGDFDYYLVIDVSGNDAISSNEYYVTVKAISPAAAGDEKTARALESCGLTVDDYKDSPKLLELVKIEALCYYGIGADLWTKSGKNIGALMKEARKESQIIRGLFGFYMDRPQNRIGQTGWDCIQGQDIRDFFANRQ